MLKAPIHLANWPRAKKKGQEKNLPCFREGVQIMAAIKRTALGRRATIDADRILAIPALYREAAIARLRDDLLATEAGPSEGSPSLSLVLTDWHDRMPEAVRAILTEFLDVQPLQLIELDLHGKVGWFMALLHARRDQFETRDSSLRTLELSLDADAQVGLLPRCVLQTSV